jgi:3-deoxy-manno-octulosonate cytidylyltransferase (CMP-KDO synthetase)
MTGFVVVIPARYASVRLPGKPLRIINGKPMLEHVWLRGMKSDATEVIVATDDQRIADAAQGFGAPVCMTGDQHRSGTERIAEVADIMDWDNDALVVNLQGDEPSMPPALINQCAGLLDDVAVDIATLASPLASQQDFDNPNVVKVVVDDIGDALYFSRASIPYPRAESGSRTAMSCALHHHGIYGYRCGVMRRLVAAVPSDLELVEQLEQLRALSLGMKIRVGRPTMRPGRGVDTEADLAAVARELDEPDRSYARRALRRREVFGPGAGSQAFSAIFRMSPRSFCNALRMAPLNKNAIVDIIFAPKVVAFASNCMRSLVLPSTSSRLRRVE